MIIDQFSWCRRYHYDDEILARWTDCYPWESARDMTFSGSISSLGNFYFSHNSSAIYGEFLSIHIEDPSQFEMISVRWCYPFHDDMIRYLFNTTGYPLMMPVTCRYCNVIQHRKSSNYLSYYMSPSNNMSGKSIMNIRPPKSYQKYKYHRVSSR